MFKPLLNELPYRIKPIINALGDGINTFLTPMEIKDSEATYIRNVSGRHYPALSVRPGRSHYAEKITTPNAAGQRNNESLHLVDGATWKYWNGSGYTTLKPDLTNAPGKFVEFGTGTTKYTIFVNGTDRFAWDGSTLTDLTNAPLSKLIAVHKGRVYMATDNDLKFAALNLINDWTTIDDAGIIDITKAKGSITGLTEYADHVLAFTEFSIHELYGTGPINYNLVDLTNDIGCISDRTIIEAQGVLYFLNYNGVYRYSGGMPVKISDKVQEYIKGINRQHKTKCVSGVLKDSLYISIVYGDATVNNLLLEYNTRLDKWYVHTGSFVDFVAIQDKLYGVDAEGYIWDMENGVSDQGAAIEWSFITKPYYDGLIAGYKDVKELWCVLELPPGNSLNAYISKSDKDDDFILMHTFTPSNRTQNVRMIIPISIASNMDWYRFKFEGTGPCKIHSIQRSVRIKVRGG